ncbi:hypothetical protein X798_04825 [Onchocerca flexuosa]|uniref:ShKT domain-containing protein n=2 Tax=Onchocerca flexuosa TaxID=387005 RepID=A0A183I5J5_9BILA|nr:hypothetical protein X798_04825 [Onchocerca flexuosa]VDP19998.1 unnamed protein product [Onchocerca flexuosa]
MEYFSVESAERMYHSCPEKCGFCNNFCADLTINCTECRFQMSFVTCSFCRVYDRGNFEPVDCSDNINYCQYKKNLCERLEHQDEMNRDSSFTYRSCDYIEKAADTPTDCQEAEMKCAKKRHLCYVEGRHSYYMWRNCKRTCGYFPNYNFNITSEDDLYSYY